ncbi:MAG: hypothetical protein GY834_02220, partial [Bacteroidetes bacterium]|nr:hypothetical protein [Bacteroidota bacterium]
MTSQELSKKTFKFLCWSCGSSLEYAIKDANNLAKRPKKVCTKCKKVCYLSIEIVDGQLEVHPKTKYKTKEGAHPTPSTPSHNSIPPNRFNSAPSMPYNIYRDINIKALLKSWSITQLLKDSRSAGKGADILMNEVFIEQGEQIHGIYWTSDTPPYQRPEFMYEHQELAMNLMDIGHLLWQASRQLAGKTTAGLLKDCEDMIFNPNYTVALVAPTVPLATEVLFKFLYNPIKKDGKMYRFYDMLKPYLLSEPNQLGFRLKNGSRLMILS